MIGNACGTLLAKAGRPHREGVKVELNRTVFVHGVMNAIVKIRRDRKQY